MRVLPDKPLAPLNQIFPHGLPLDEGVVMSEEGFECFILKDESFTPETGMQILEVLHRDDMPVILAITALTWGVILIPKSWCEEAKNIEEN